MNHNCGCLFLAIISFPVFGPIPLIVYFILVSNKNKSDQSSLPSFDSLPVSLPPGGSTGNRLSSGSMELGSSSGAFGGGFNERNGFDDPSISFLPQSGSSSTSARRKVNLKRQTSKTATKLPPQMTQQSAKERQQVILNQLRAIKQKSDFGFTKNDILKAFVMQELLQKHDLNKIFERVPEINRDI